MAKAGRLTKLKSALKKWPSIGKLGRSNSSTIAADTPAADYDPSCHSEAGYKDPAGTVLHPVYVGQSRRLYLVGSDVVGHPLFRELVGRSGSSDGVNIACEVVLFEHLLWMLENADPCAESMDELIDFYTC